MEGPVLDYVLVPAGLVALLAYHAWLLHRVVRYPNKTIIGVNAINRRFWVQAMMEVCFAVPSDHPVLAAVSFSFDSGRTNRCAPMS